MSEQNKNVDVDVKLKVSDVLRFNMHIAYKSVFSKVVLALGVGLLVFLVYKFMTRTAPLDIFISENILFIMLPIFILIATPWKVWNITASQMQSPIFANGSKYIFYPDKIYIQAGELADEVPWETYSRIIETGKDFRFFVDKVQAQIVPKHNMTEMQIKELRELIKSANPKEVYKVK
ncbi:MAG: YcxB family protein [Cellulosilyticaceae bacterium]